MTSELVVPRYGSGSLADVVPSVLASLGAPGERDVLGIAAATGGAPRVCVLLVDGLGSELLRAHAADAPFLTSLAAGRDPITAGFPSSTAVSVSAIGTGLPPGEHGVVGYTFAAQVTRPAGDPTAPARHHGVDGFELLDSLKWVRHAVADRADAADLRDVVVPEDLQPRATAFERAAAAGVTTRVVAPWLHAGSGLTRASLRGARFDGVLALGDLVGRTVAALREPGPLLCYSYFGDLDLCGHLYGPGSAAWRWQLGFVDRLAAAIADALPAGAALLVTADHGMVPVAPADAIDVDTTPALRDGVTLLGGEPRVRHVHAEPGAVDDVRAAWTATLGGRAVVASRAEAVAAGWFGPVVSPHVLPRIGDLVVATLGTAAITRSVVEPQESALVGHHGSLTAAEQLVPLLATTTA